jgi:hypothetical protein
MPEQEIEGRTSGRFRAADQAIEPASPIAAGPFDLPCASRNDEAASLPDALITGLLVVYPALATVVALIVGLSLAGPVV